MMRSVSRLLPAALLSAALLAVPVAGLSDPEAGTALRPTDQPGDSSWLVVEHLRERYGVTRAEAQRRVEVQRGLPELVTYLERRLPETYAGLWLDQENGGVLHIAVTDPAAAGDALAPIAGRDHVRVVRAARSLQELRGVADRLERRVPEPSGVRVSVDPVRNRVAAEVPPGSAGDRLAASLTGDLSIADRAAVVTRAPRTELKGDRCDPLACNPPMRGGLRLDIQRTVSPYRWGGCTNGFNVKDSRGWTYTLTAGHCLLSDYHSGTGEVTFHNGLPVGQETSESVGYWSRALDYMILPYYAPAGQTNWAGYWLTNRQEVNTVAVYRASLTTNADYACVDGYRDQPGYLCNYARSSIFGVANVGALAPGTIVCSSGTASGRTSSSVGGATIIDRYLPAWKPRTSCGRVNAVSTYQVDAQICTAPGDSGGPLWDPTTGRGVGIVRAGPDAQSTLGVCASPGNTYFSRLDWILTHASSRFSDRSFSLITSYSG
ncbi:MAG: hypothetical protein ACRDT6_05015 [Micromonosporaceae bacterium]